MHCNQAADFARIPAFVATRRMESITVNACQMERAQVIFE